MILRKSCLPIALLAAAGLFSGCVANSPNGGNASAASDPRRLNVTVTDDGCAVSAAEAPSGTVRFTLVNKGTVRNEFEILAPDRLRIVGERENLGPGTTTEYTINLSPGEYVTACKKNMVGALVGVTPFRVKDSGDAAATANADEQKLSDEAVANYTAYVRDQVGQLLTATEAFSAAYRAGETEKAKSLYASTRMHFERIEPTAEQFGDLDPALDLREADWQADQSTPWTGWHVAEKDLWRPEGYAGLKPEERTEIATKLSADTQKLYDLVYSPDFKLGLDNISNGAIGLLEEVATTKITGEEEAFSHTDLYDFQANLEGAKVAFGTVEAIAKRKDPALTAEITDKIESLEEKLADHKQGDGFVSYDTVDERGRKELSDSVNALRRPLAQLTEVLLK